MLLWCMEQGVNDKTEQEQIEQHTGVDKVQCEVDDQELGDLEMVEDSVSSQSTRKLYKNFFLPYESDKAILMKHQEFDCKTYLSQYGWQDIFEPSNQTALSYAVQNLVLEDLTRVQV